MDIGKPRPLPASGIVTTREVPPAESDGVPTTEKQRARPPTSPNSKGADPPRPPEEGDSIMSRTVTPAYLPARPGAAVPPGVSPWSIQEAADYLGVNRETIRRWIARGDLKAHRVGPRLVRIDPADVVKLRRPIGSQK